MNRRLRQDSLRGEHAVAFLSNGFVLARAKRAETSILPLCHLMKSSFFFITARLRLHSVNQSRSSRGRSGHHWGAVLNISTLLQGPLSQSRGRPANQEEISSGIPTTEASLPSQSLVSPNPLLLDTTGSRVHNYNPRQTDTHSCTSS